MSAKSTMLITGTSRGIGRAVAEYFAEADYIVIGCSRSASNLEHPNYKHYLLDLTEENAVRSFIRSCKKEFQKIDVLIANAGLVDSSLLFSVTSGNLFNKFLNTNLTSAFYICREVSKIMVSQQHGRIITMSSIMATIHQPGTSIYSATKAALAEMTKVMARELAASGITCNVIAPCLVETESSSALSENAQQLLLAQQTIQRPATIADLCHAITYLSAPECSYLSGQILDICMTR